MDYEQGKENINKDIEILLKKIDLTLPESSQVVKLNELQEDIKKDQYSIMVVGEFKHGKSTFVNALLGQDIMPRGVTPTTATINIAQYGKKQNIEIVKSNGIVENYDSVDILSHYTAEKTFDYEDIKFIKLKLDSPLLENRVVLVDTPGVNDLSEQRREVTHQFLPRADVVIFMCSLTSPIKNSEEKFIKERLIKNGMEKVIYAANFMDNIEEEELEELIEFVERRLKHINGGHSQTVFPISSKEALDGRLTNDTNLLQFSGILEVEMEIKQQIKSGLKGQEKIERFNKRFALISEIVLQEVETAEVVSTQSVGEIKQQLKAVSKWLDHLSKQENELQNYLFDRETEINFMIGKSIHHFGERLKADIENRIHIFQGADIKSLVETQIPFAIKSQFSHWMDQYEDSIQQLLLKLEKEVARGLAQSFNTSVQVQTRSKDAINHLTSIPIFEAKSGNANVKAGFILGGVGSIALLVGAPFFLPIVGMAGLPFVSQKIAEKQLENIKPDLIYTVQKKINMMIIDLEKQLQEYIEKAVNQVKDNSVEEFNRLLHSYEMILKDEVEKQETQVSNLHTQGNRLKDLKNG